MFYSSEIKEKAKELYLKYKSYRRVGKELNITGETVRYWFNPKLKEKRKQYSIFKKTHLNNYNNKYYIKLMEKLKDDPVKKEEYLKRKREANKRYYPKKLAKYIKHPKPKVTTEQIFNYKIGKKIRARIKEAIKFYNSNKCFKSEELLGCTILDARKHIESLFKEGMMWENHGHGGWHIDHIIPCKSFDLTKPEEQKKCFHYTNLQPLWAKDNLKKGCRYE